MNPREILKKAETKCDDLIGQQIDILTINRPEDISVTKKLVKITSKLSPIYANSIEHRIAGILNEIDWDIEGEWVRQDPGFPDLLFDSSEMSSKPGIEIKSWYPLATEITARFKESQTMFTDDNTDVLIIVWIPEHVVWGKATIIGTYHCSAKSIAEARDNHYHNPPDYLVFEPEDTSDRTQNLIQTNTNGYKLQTKNVEKEAKLIVNGWGPNPTRYDTSSDYQSKLKQLRGTYEYRLDTNYAKIDRIQHDGIEQFKEEIMNRKYNGKTIREWTKIMKKIDEEDENEEINALLQRLISL